MTEPSTVREAGDLTDPPGNIEHTKPEAGVEREVSAVTAANSTSNASDTAQPVFGGSWAEIRTENDDFGTEAKVADDGRVNIQIKEKSRRLSSIFSPALNSQLEQANAEIKPPRPVPYIPQGLGEAPGHASPPALNVVIHVVGSRGDVQPFIALGKVLKDNYGHRVRLATHPIFKGFVEENGLEFFTIGGDPTELMAFMVKNPGLMPGVDTLRSGDVGRRRKGMAEMIKGCWRSCIEAGDGFGAEASDQLLEQVLSQEGGADLDDSGTFCKPFIADAIIANPPSFAHIHCAEKLGIPLHIMFTMPWSPTLAFPHPLANIQASDADTSLSNLVSYALVDMLTWQGLGDVINKFRINDLGLDPIGLMWAPGLLARLRIPYTYCWSPALIPKPSDWPKHISISGFFFLNLATNYTPDPKLLEFLDAGPPPVYIGFGSIVVDDPNAMTRLIFEAVKTAGRRALVSKGWGGFGADEIAIPDGVFMLGNVPHDWLFQHVSCVVHHGGAGTTAAGIAAGKPTIIVPFFGDQPFWGSMVARAGAGPRPIPYKQLTAAKLAEAILKALEPAVIERAQRMSRQISTETGTENAAISFHQMLDVDHLRCTLAPKRVAVWRVKRTHIRLSGFAATVLASEGLISFGDLKLYRAREYDTEDEPWDPVTGVTTAIVGTLSNMAVGVADVPIDTIKALKTRHDSFAKITPFGTKSPNSAPKTRDESSKRAVSPLTASDTRPALESISTVTFTAGDMESAKKDLSHVSTQTESDVTDKARSPNSVQPFIQQALYDRAHHGVSTGNVHMQNDNPKGHHSIMTSHQHHQHRNNSTHAHGTAGKLHEAATFGSDIGVARSVGAVLKSPMDFTMALARGFHNAPKLYGDKVRPTQKISGIHSGVTAAGKEFGYGIYDGISGVITKPYTGAKKEGPVGFLKGVGKGFGGLLLKPSAAILGLPGYTFKGIYREIHKLFGTSIKNYIIAARMVQGHEDFQSSTVEEREEVVKRWHIVRRDASMSKKTLKQHTKARHTSADPDAPPAPFSTVATYSNKDDRIVEVKLLLRHTHTFPLTGPEALAAHAIESSIHSSVVRASQGDAEQDRLIEHAIRASIAELDKLQGQDIGPEEALQRAIDASVNEAREHTSTPIDRDALTKALRASLYETRREHLDDSGTDSDDEEELNRAIEEAHRKAQAHSSEHKPEDLASVHQHVTDTQPTPTAGQEGTIVTEHGLVERMNDHALQSDSPGDTNT